MNLDLLFRQILKPALGCTEPVSVALAAAAAVQASSGWTPSEQGLSLTDVKEEDVREVRVAVSRNIFKNAFAILIPNTGGRKGIVMAGALGIFCDPRLGMNLFHALNDASVVGADTLVREKRVRVVIAENAPSDVYINVEVEMKSGSGMCVIQNEHDNLACLKRNGTISYGCDETLDESRTYSCDVEELKELRISEIVALVDDLPESVLTLLRETTQKNVAACEAGLARPTGIGTGYFAMSSESPVSFNSYLSALTAAGSDARMSGSALEIMTSAGSGNQGIAATIPVVAYGRANRVEDSRLMKALALSHLMTMHMTAHIGYLSALCGVAIKAGVGAASGVTYAMGGNAEDVERAIKIMAATLSGMICDGAKVGCALKVSSAADMAMRAATLAIRRSEVPDDNGIVACTAEQTIRNLAELSRSMGVVDQKLIEIMLAKIS